MMSICQRLLRAVEVGVLVLLASSIRPSAAWAPTSNIRLQKPHEIWAKTRPDQIASDSNDFSMKKSERRKLENESFFLPHRRQALQILLSTVAAAESTVAAELLPPSGVYKRETDKFAYEFQPPYGFNEPSQKPVKTHLDEVNFKSIEYPAYSFGITVDPVRISSLEEFGTPEAVAAKVVLAEVNRDGVFDVKLMEDPLMSKDDTDATYYQLNYLSSGKRGDKRFVAKFFIYNQKLYALTAQCKETDYPKVKDELINAVTSFRLIG